MVSGTNAGNVVQRFFLHGVKERAVTLKPNLGLKKEEEDTI